MAYHLASGENDMGLHPSEYPRRAACHVHDLWAAGLADEGHQVFYRLRELSVSQLRAASVSQKRIGLNLCTTPALCVLIIVSNLREDSAG